jgi:predicted AAA+ superfamily ATPase
VRYISRKIEGSIRRYLEIFPVVSVTGPRQSGKSTTLRTVFGTNYEYVTFDDPLNIEFLTNDPKGFFKQYRQRIIFDEAQAVPQLFNYLKIEVDNNRSDYGRYLLTGSSQFALIKSITESLAGRIGLLSLLPLHFSEVPAAQQESHIIFGGYPELITRDYKNRREWYGAYLTNYVERDVRAIHNIGNLRDFHRLIMLLAARVSGELNMSQLAREIGVTVRTIQSWLSILEASYIIFLLPPYYNNFGKRIIKRPKIFFYDSGLVCYCLGIQNIETLRRGPLDGQIFENYIIAEIRKEILHSGGNKELFYFRSNLGIECDLIIDDKDTNQLRFVEVKSGYTPKREMIKNIDYLIQKQLKQQPSSPQLTGYVTYRGRRQKTTSDNILFINYRDFINGNY